MLMAVPQKVAAIRCEPNYRDSSAIQGAVSTALEMLEPSPEFIAPGERVVLKPNWVKEHDERKPGPNQWEHVVTHPAVIEAVAAWAAAYLRGSGSVTICDAPQTDSSFRRIVEYCDLGAMLARLRARFAGVEFRLLDLRPEEWEAVDGVV